jgi:hypothetical protein
MWRKTLDWNTDLRKEDGHLTKDPIEIKFKDSHNDAEAKKMDFEFKMKPHLSLMDKGDDWNEVKFVLDSEHAQIT